MAIPTFGTQDFITAVRDRIAGDGRIGRLGEVVEYVEQTWTDLVTGESLTIFGGGAAEESAAAATGIADIALVPLLLAVVGILVLGNIVNRSLKWILDKAVPFHFGRKAWPIIDILLPFNGPLLGWVTDRLAHLAGNIVHSMRNWFHAMVQWVFPSTTHGVIQVNPHAIAELQAEINKVAHSVSVLTTAVQHLEAHVYGRTSLPPGVQTLENRVSRLERAESIIAHDLNVLHHAVVTTQGQSLRVTQEIATLTHALHQVRAVAYGVQDLEEMLQGKLSTLTSQVTQLESHTLSNTHTLTVLWPLSALLYRGLPGIRNLQKLEDNPCQCKRFGSPKLPFNFWDIVTAEQFLNNG